MKKLFLILSGFMLFVQQTALCGVPIKIIDSNNINETIIRGQSLENIDTTVDGNTITINFLADFGSVGIFIETILGSLVAGMTCHIILGKANVQVSGIGTFSFRIVSASATYSG